MSGEPASPLRGVLARYPGVAETTVGIHHVTGGHVTRGWRIDTATGALLLRRLPAETPADTAAAAAVVQDHAARAGLAPGLVVNDTGGSVTAMGGRLFTLSTHLQGTNPARGVPGAGFCRRLGRALGHLHQQIREVPAGGLRPWQLPGTAALREALRAHDRPGCRHPATRRVLAAKLAHAQAIPTSFRARLNGLDRQVIHGDVHPGNILLINSRAVFVDFDLARLAPPGYELMRALIYCTHPAGPPHAYRERVAAFLSGYLTTRPLTDLEIATMVELYRTVQVLDPYGLHTCEDAQDNLLGFGHARFALLYWLARHSAGLTALGRAPATTPEGGCDQRGRAPHDRCRVSRRGHTAPDAARW